MFQSLKKFQSMDNQIEGVSCGKYVYQLLLLILAREVLIHPNKTNFLSKLQDHQ